MAVVRVAQHMQQVIKVVFVPVSDMVLQHHLCGGGSEAGQVILYAMPDTALCIELINVVGHQIKNRGRHTTSYGTKKE
jgi:hypothetical protein